MKKVKSVPSHLNHMFSECFDLALGSQEPYCDFNFLDPIVLPAYWKLIFANNTLIAISKTFWLQCASYWKFILWTVVLLIFLLSCWWCFSYVVNALSFQALTKAGICNAQSTDNPLSLWSLPVLIEHNVRFCQFPFRLFGDS